MFGLSSEIRAGGICVNGDVGSLALVLKFKQRCAIVVPVQFLYFIVLATD